MKHQSVSCCVYCIEYVCGRRFFAKGTTWDVRMCCHHIRNRDYPCACIAGPVLVVFPRCCSDRSRDMVYSLLLIKMKHFNHYAVMHNLAHGDLV